jgi:hypothetical protein
MQRNTEKAFIWITDLLEKMGVAYKISGGFAARVHGADRELADIDIVVAEEDIPKIAAEVEPYVIFGPEQYKDENWDLLLMTLNFAGQEIDIADTHAKIFNTESGEWESCDTGLLNADMKEAYGKTVPVEKVETLIAEKVRLAREVDLEAVRQLRDKFKK